MIMVYKYEEFGDFLGTANQKLVDFCNSRESSPLKNVKKFDVIDIIKSESGNLVLFYKEEVL